MRVSIEQVIDALESDHYVGFCLECGAEAYDVEPDARRYECENCGKRKVYGAEEILLMVGAHTGGNE
jgi:DNA-directed RNA polymerase subunit RPC12/RpoP